MYFCNSCSWISDLILTAASHVSEQFLICENGFEWLDDQKDPGRQEENAGHVIRTLLSLLQELQYVCYWLIFATTGVLRSRPGGRMWTASLIRRSSTVFLTFVISERLLTYSNTYIEKTLNEWICIIYGQRGQVSWRLYNHRPFADTNQLTSLSTLDSGRNEFAVRE